MPEGDAELDILDKVLPYLGEFTSTRGGRPLPSPSAFESSPAPRAELERAFLGSGPVLSCCNLLHPRRERFPNGRRLDIVHPNGVY